MTAFWREKEMIIERKKAEKKQAYHYLAANRKRSREAPLSFV